MTVRRHDEEVGPDIVHGADNFLGWAVPVPHNRLHANVLFAQRFYCDPVALPGRAAGRHCPDR